MFDSLPPEEQPYREEVYSQVKAPGGCESIRPFPVGYFVRCLQQIAEVLVVTSPFKGSPTWAHEREAALEKHFDVSHTDVIHAKRKGFIRGDVFVDDKLNNVLEWRDAHPQGKAIHWSSEEDSILGVIRTKYWGVVLEQARSFSRFKGPSTQGMW